MSAMKDVALNDLEAGHNARKFDESVIETMILAIKEHGGPFQPPGVVATGSHFRIVWGHHRIEACRRAGLQTISVRILPEGTTKEQELEYSLHENHVRSNEDFEDTLERIEAYAALSGCSLKDAAAKAGVSPTLVSKWQSASKHLHADVKELAKEHNVGISLLYALSKCHDPEQQRRLLAGYLDGTMNRDEVAKAVKQPNASKPQPLKIQLSVSGCDVAITLPASANYEDLLSTLATTKSLIVKQRKQQIPLHLLSEVLNAKEALRV